MKLKILAISAVTILMLTATAGEREVNNERLSEGSNQEYVDGTGGLNGNAGRNAGQAVSTDSGNIHSEIQTGIVAEKYRRPIRPIPIKEDNNNDRGTEGTIQDNSESAGAGEVGTDTAVDVGDGIFGTSGYTDPADDETGQYSDSGDTGQDTEPSSGEPEEPVSIPEGADGDNAEELGDNGGYSGGDEGNQPESESDSETDEEVEWKYYGNCRITHYCDCQKCTGQWYGSETASGEWPIAFYTVATGPDIPFYTEIMINGQVYQVHDRGVGNDAVDIYVGDHQLALDMGEYWADVYVRW